VVSPVVAVIVPLVPRLIIGPNVCPASFDDSGAIRVADIWESEDQWNNFLNTRLMPFMQKTKVPPLRTEIFPIHNINALSGLDSYKVR
jgi:hypothetical protein